MSQVQPSRHRRLGAVIGALLDPALEPIVDMVVTRDGSGYEARALDRAVRFRRDSDEVGRRYTEVHVEGRNPLGDTATDRFPTLAAERATQWPTRTDGMEDTNPAVTGDWSIALDACGVPYRDEAYGFIYVDP